MGVDSSIRPLIQKYSYSGPRYTSYPTAPQWSDALGFDSYRQYLLGMQGENERDLALYFHIPFCESLCYYCGCNIQITKQREKGPQYVDSLMNEMKEIAGLLGMRRTVSQISWGGGTPTFLSVEDIKRLHQTTQKYFTISDDAEVSIEVDPRVTSEEQLEWLASLGFNRISLGVQDFNLQVQEAINRVQSREMTETMLKKCRSLGFKGINFDLIYGLPHQTVSSFEKTIDEVIEIRPDRIAFYNYAHLPNMIKHQSILDKMPMPSADERVDIFSLGYERLIAAGYHPIGMDHFAVENDELATALPKGRLHRNFMGYTVKRGTDMIGIGASAIGELDGAYFQNQRSVKEYQEGIQGKGLAAFRGVLLSEDDKRRKWAIQALMCRFYVNFAEYRERFGEEFTAYFRNEIPKLEDFYADEILTSDAAGITVTRLGRLFIRNVAMVFDAYLTKGKPIQYSKTV